MGFSAGPRGIQDACRSVNTRPDTGFSLTVNEKRTINGEGVVGSLGNTGSHLPRGYGFNPHRKETKNDHKLLFALLQWCVWNRTELAPIHPFPIH